MCKILKSRPLDNLDRHPTHNSISFNIFRYTKTPNTQSKSLAEAKHMLLPSHMYNDNNIKPEKFFDYEKYFKKYLDN